MVKDLFIIDTRCHLNRSIQKAFEKNGYEVQVSMKYIHDMCAGSGRPGEGD